MAVDHDLLAKRRVAMGGMVGGHMSRARCRVMVVTADDYVMGGVSSMVVAPMMAQGRVMDAHRGVMTMVMVSSRRDRRRQRDERPGD